ncbi:MAG: histidine phosphatase family protein [Bifidobacteriaceae bacterium]|jgi:phosphohistidine phosphatase|nr:histidine phosphatase family protein [Bifidobacteriaceae bacterium]
MQRTLVLARHAKAMAGDGGGDADRPLSELGYEQCRIVARELGGLGLQPAVALVSKAKRALQTFHAMSAAASWSCVPDIREDLYTGYVDEILDAVREADPDAGVVMVFGHEPTMSAAGFRLAGAGSDPGAVTRVRRGLPTAGLAVLEVDGLWESVGRGNTKLRWILTPLA